MRKILFLVSALLFLMVSHIRPAYGQVKVLSLDETLNIIRKYHPVANQANLSVSIAEASLQANRGAFDPSLYLRNERKTFDGKNYFSYTNQELKIPTWFGVDIKAGFENNIGDRVEPMFSPGKSTYAGLSIPLLKNLLFDKRRAAVQQGKIMVNLSNQERFLAINDLLFEAVDAYWAWVSAHQVYLILTNTLKINTNRFENTKQLFEGGDRAAIDTTEALSQLQIIESMQIQAWLSLQKQRLLLSNFLWKESNTPYELTEDIMPDSSWNSVSIQAYPLPSLTDAITTAINTHPKLLSLGYKVNMLDVDKRAKFQGLLPTFDINYNFLNKGYGTKEFFGSQLFSNNYKYGFQLGMPLFQRQSRGEYTMAKLKIKSQQLENSQQRLEIENKVKSYFNELMAMQKQVLLFDRNVKNQQLLVVAEEYKFSVGESSLFLVNSRENKLLETQQKLAELKTKFFKSMAALQWSAGQLR
jgi:outer membrane protein TolC